jgi:uncharacterized protein (TIGR00290 family)
MGETASTAIEPPHHNPVPALLSWSGGKDCCMALSAMQRRGTQVRALLTTVTSGLGRTGMHRVRPELIRRQAVSLGLPLLEIAVPERPSNAVYEAALADAVAPFRREGVETIAFGDLHLADIRAYRDALAMRLGMTASYPVWGRDPATLIREFLDAGYRAVVVCVDAGRLPAEFAGREVDGRFLADLPAGVDPCGENGEFHTFVYGGPAFARPIPVLAGETIRDGPFCFRDFRLAEEVEAA